MTNKFIYTRQSHLHTLYVAGIRSLSFANVCFLPLTEPYLTPMLYAGTFYTQDARFFASPSEIARELLRNGNPVG